MVLQKEQMLPSMEFNRRIAAERELENFGSLRHENAGLLLLLVFFVKFGRFNRCPMKSFVLRIQQRVLNLLSV